LLQKAELDKSVQDSSVLKTLRVELLLKHFGIVLVTIQVETLVLELNSCCQFKDGIFDLGKRDGQVRKLHVCHFDDRQ
jgi:hypothetical protein